MSPFTFDLQNILLSFRLPFCFWNNRVPLEEGFPTVVRPLDSAVASARNPPLFSGMLSNF